VAVSGGFVKVAEIQGALLDYWVARAGNWPRPRIDDGLCWIDVPACDGDPAGALDAAFSPSSDWEIGGPIIERERLAIQCGWLSDPDCWVTTDLGHGYVEMVSRTKATTPLVAAMRAYVASKFGEEVEDAPQGTI
jgi:hypothetical protein